MTTLASTPPQAVTGSTPGLGDTVASEWAKLRSAKAPRRNLVLAILLGAGMSLLLCLAVGASYDQANPAEQADLSDGTLPLAGTFLSLIFLSVFGVGTAAQEYATGMMRLTLTITPKRTRLLVAKAIVVAVGSWVASAIGVAIMHLGGGAVLRSFDVDLPPVGDPDILRVLIITVLLSPVFPLLGLWMAFLLRTNSAAITAVLGIMFVPMMFGGLLPAWWQRNVVSLLPASAQDAASMGHITDNTTYLSNQWLAGLVCVAWAVGVGVIANAFFRRRDA